ncbi:hypothetical protein BXY57_0643 [Thermoflavifilum aggregans]|uniref:Uncharacterized protein n=2 Tax=Thermoflavifilum TaxID=1649506 RepID=A0A1I7N5R3_9BACT|nr:MULTISPECIES: DUF6728 family protein [Thermoflavifilum]MBX6379262.1 hypothetical protein [Thermoflavifilum aggregans]PJJ75074.1 hypothetical protein BXY57_0643 [Thermoflavifilum aggregans]SFV30017.1 hypothetical protein SAMN05660895_0679 [Thermoflavifilum thermophilum]
MKSIWQQILRYLYLRKRDPNAPHNTNIFLMHSMNRISILLFLVALIVLLVRLVKHFL